MAYTRYPPDKFGNRSVGDSLVPQDGSVRDSLVIDTKIYGKQYKQSGPSR